MINLLSFFKLRTKEASRKDVEVLGIKPKKTKGGRNQDPTCLDALPVQ